MWAIKDLIPLAVYLAVLAVLVAVAKHVIGKVRAKSREDQPSTMKLLEKFREARLQGELSEAEFRTIKTRLADKAMDELNGQGERR